MKYLDQVYRETSKGVTENGAVTLTRSGSPLLDFFAQAGAMRGNKDGALDLFKKAFSEDREKAIRILFYLRDIRGGQGERDLFRVCLEWIGSNYQDVFEQIINYIPEYGRWDDMFFDNARCFSFMLEQLEHDRSADSPSLLAKWLPTINASSDKTRAKAKFFAGKFDLNDKAYRIAVRDIRKKIATVEEKMSARKWGDINYSSIPSQASRIYKNAFKKHDEKRYTSFIEKAISGEVKINTSTLYPYQVYKDVGSMTAEALWKQLPDYTQGKNALVVADVSGSMHGDPIAVSVSLALYFAERNVGQFKDYFMTFSSEPVLQKIVGKTLLEKTNSIARSKWDMTTNIQAVFDVLLGTAIKNSTPPAELPETIYIISDMEFDMACTYHTNLETIARKYEGSGYKIPNLVFWNVRASGKNLPADKNERGISLVSGFSPSIFKLAVENKTPEETMTSVIESDRYSIITITK